MSDLSCEVCIGQKLSTDLFTAFIYRAPLWFNVPNRWGVKADQEPRGCF